jgi:hypothetical protein
MIDAHLRMSTHTGQGSNFKEDTFLVRTSMDVVDDFLYPFWVLLPY